MSYKLFQLLSRSLATLTIVFICAPKCVSVRVNEPQASEPPKRPIVLRQENGRLLFDPAHQMPVRYDDKEFSIKLVVGDWNINALGNKEGRKLSVLVTKTGTPPRSIALPNEIAQVNEIHRVQGDKAVVLGMFNGDSNIFSVLNLSTYVIEDIVFCYDPTLSPDGRYVSFVKFFPAHFVANVEAHYMIYDFGLSAAQNRPGESYGVSDKVNVGLCVYPPRTGNVPSDNTTIAPENAHFVASQGFFWRPDSGAYVFADEYRGKLSVVMVRVGTSVTATSIIPVPQEQLCGSIDKPRCQAGLTAAKFVSEPFTGVTTTFRGYGPDASLHKTFPFPYDLFHDVH